MDEKVLWSLAGIALGWLLNQTSAAIKERTQTRQDLGRVISSLMLLYLELDRVYRQQNFYKDQLASWEAYEKYRAESSARLIGKDVELGEPFDSVINTVAAYAPMHAVSLQHVRGFLGRFRAFDLSPMASDRDKYIKILSSLEVGYELTQRLLERTLRRLSWKHGVDTWIRVGWHMRRHRKGVDKNAPFITKLLTEIAEPTKPG